MSDTEQTPTPAPEAVKSGDEQGQQGEQQEQGERTYTQADLDAAVSKIAAKIKADERRKVDKTSEDRIADLEKQYKAAEARALRSDIAAAHGISAEDRDLFLTGEDEETLTAQAKRLADRESERKKRSNHVPNEGNNPKSKADPMRDVARNLFGRDD